MPVYALIIAFQVVLVVHVIRTGRNTLWIWLVIFVPLIGGLAYFFVELLPELLGGRTVRRAKRGLMDAINPDRGLKQAERRLEVADTVQNSMDLAQECLDKGRFAEARDLYSRCLKGPYADDPFLMLGLAQAVSGLGDHAGAVRTLDELRAANPDFKSPEGHLLYARSLEGMGRVDDAISELRALLRYYKGPEPAVRLGMILKARGQFTESDALFARVVEEARIAGGHYRDLHREWVAIATREDAQRRAAGR